MALALQATQLLSRIIRLNASQGKTGEALIRGGTGQLVPRKISKLTKLGEDQQPGNLAQRLWDGAKRLTGFVGTLFKGIGFSATKVFQGLLNVGTKIWTFNWNASDAELSQMIKGQNLALASAAGSAVGGTLGWIASIGVGYGISFLCPVIGGAVLARYIAGTVTREALEEMIPQYGNLLQQVAGTLANNAAIFGYMKARKIFKFLPQGNGGPDMSFAAQTERAIEAIPNEYVRAFVESAVDEFADAFMEGGFIIATEIDNAYAQHRIANQAMLGTERTVKVVPDTNADDEVLTFAKVPQNLLMPAIQSAVNTHRLVHNRDMGQIVGQPATEWARARPQLRQLTIVFRDRPKPPWRHTDGKRCREATYAIPDVRPGLTWREIKNVADAFNWGKYRATAQLDNQRQMAVYGASPGEAKAKLRELMRLSTAEILTLSVTEEEDRPIKLKKDTTRMYPAFATLLARRNSTDANGRVTLDNRILDERIHRFPLWTDTEPKNMPLLQ